MSCPINISVFSENSNVNYDRIVNWDNTNEKCMSIAYDNSLSFKNNNIPEIKEISCNTIKPNSKLVIYTYKNSSNDIISCPLGGWCSNINNQQLLRSGINNDQINNDFKLNTIDGVTNINISDLCLVNNASTATENPTASEKSTATENPTATENQITTEKSTASEKSTATENSTITENPTATENSTITENPTASEKSTVERQVQNNCTLKYFNNSLNNGSLDCNAINRENLFISNICKFRIPDNSTSICENTEMNLKVQTNQPLATKNCSDNSIIQTYQLIDNITQLECPIGGFCDNETNRNNLKIYMNNSMNNLKSIDPRCALPGTSEQSPPMNNEPGTSEQSPPMNNEPGTSEQSPPMNNDSGSSGQTPPTNNEQIFNVICPNNNTFQAYKITDSPNSIICPVGDYCNKEENKTNLKGAIIYDDTKYLIKNNAKLIPDGQTEYDKNNTISLYEICNMPNP